MRWYANVARGSRVTADVYLRRLGALCKFQKIKPQDLVSPSDKDLSYLLMDFVSWSEKQGHAGSYIQSTLKAVRSWLQHNHRDVKVKIKVKGSDDTPTLRKERVPTRKEMRRFSRVNWSEVAREAIERRIEVLKKMEGLVSESKLSEEDAVALGRKISKKLGKAYEG